MSFDTEVQNVSPLSERELACVRGFADGKTAKHVARDLGITHNVVGGYLQIARLKVGAKTTTGLVAIALRKGWIQ